jgi:hypothetical protein
VLGTLVVSGLSFALAPALWLQWVQSLAHNASIPTGDYVGALGGPLWLRGLAAVVVVSWGALTNRRWTVPVAATLAIPLLAYFNLSLLVSLVPLVLPAAVPRLSRWLLSPASGHEAAAERAVRSSVGSA